MYSVYSRLLSRDIFGYVQMDWLFLFKALKSTVVANAKMN